MKTMKYFFECCFNQSEGFEDLDRIIKNFKTYEIEITQLALIKELHQIMGTNNYGLASQIIEKYGNRELDDLEEVKRFINFLYDKLIDRHTEVKATDFEKKFKGVFCPVCCPNPETTIPLSLIEKATVITNGLQIYICKPCKLVWFTEDIQANNAQNYKQFMRTLKLKGLWKELKDVDIL